MTKITKCESKRQKHKNKKRSTNFLHITRCEAPPRLPPVSPPSETRAGDMTRYFPTTRTRSAASTVNAPRAGRPPSAETGPSGSATT